ncbi:cyclin-I-like [Dysidea avara]|uniref:cyclin-I-like n=1 Tax=Dysidea avara TaxID=196820 RepID=UPI003318844F
MVIVRIGGLLCSEPLEERLLKLVASEECSQLASNQCNSTEYVSPATRDQAVSLLRGLTKKLECYCETFARAVSILDAFLNQVKVRVKFLNCLAVTCFFIAAKLEEDIEYVPSLEQLVEQSGCGCSTVDIQRMELIVMQKLEFNLVRSAPLDFLRIFHTLATINRMLQLPVGMTASQHLRYVTYKLELLLCSSHFLNFKPSVLALAVIGCELKLMGNDWLAILMTLQDKAQVDGANLSVCWEHVTSYYTTLATTDIR